MSLMRSAPPAELGERYDRLLKLIAVIAPVTAGRSGSTLDVAGFLQPNEPPAAGTAMHRGGTAVEALPLLLTCSLV